MKLQMSTECQKFYRLHAAPSHAGRAQLKETLGKQERESRELCCHPEGLVKTPAKGPHEVQPREMPSPAPEEQQLSAHWLERSGVLVGTKLAASQQRRPTARCCQQAEEVTLCLFSALVRYILGAIPPRTGETRTWWSNSADVPKGVEHLPCWKSWSCSACLEKAQSRSSQHIGMPDSGG